MADEQDQTSGQDGEDIVHEGAENGTAARLQALEASAANNEAKGHLLQLLADPDIQSVLRAKRAGKAVTVAEAQEGQELETSANTDAEEPGDPNDPATQMLTKISKLIDAKFDKRFAPLQEQLESVSGIANNVVSEKVNSQVDAARKKYPDFDKFGKQMLEINKQMDGRLPVEEVYILAKQRSGTLRMMEQRTETERPTIQPRRNTGGKPPASPQKIGNTRNAFREALNAKLANLSFEGAENL